MAIERANSPLVLLRGDSFVMQYTVRDVDEVTGVKTPVDITNFKITGQARYTPDSAQVWYDFPIVKSDPTNGVFQWYLTHADSKGLLPAGANTPNEGVYDMQLIINEGHPTDERVLTFLYGSFRVTADVTRSGSTPRIESSARRILGR